MRNRFLKIFSSRMLVALLVVAALLFSCGGDDGINLNLEHLVDVEGTVYVAVPIGNQIWMAENLNVKKYNDGTDIPYVTDNDSVGTLTTGAYSYYAKNPANGDVYGALYNWHAIGSRKLCPVGWHVPSDAEWSTRINFLGGEDVAGGPLEITTAHWSAPNAGATNDSGFSAVPAGYLFE